MVPILLMIIITRNPDPLNLVSPTGPLGKFPILVLLLVLLLWSIMLRMTQCIFISHWYLCAGPAIRFNEWSSVFLSGKWQPFYPRSHRLQITPTLPIVISAVDSWWFHNGKEFGIEVIDQFRPIVRSQYPDS